MTSWARNLLKSYYYGRATGAFFRCRFEDAIRLFEQRYFKTRAGLDRRSDLDDVFAYIFLGLSYMKTGRADFALDRFDNAFGILKSHPKLVASRMSADEFNRFVRGYVRALSVAGRAEEARRIASDASRLYAKGREE